MFRVDFKLNQAFVGAIVNEELDEHLSPEEKKRFVIDKEVESISQEMGIDVKEFINIYEDYYIE